MTAKTWGEYIKAPEAEWKAETQQWLSRWANVAKMWECDDHAADAKEEQQNTGEVPL